MLQKWEEERVRAREERVVKRGKSRVEINSWLQHTRWPEHLEGFEVEKLRASAQPMSDGEDEGEMGLQRVCKQVGQVVRIAFGKCSTHCVSRFVLHAINRRENGASNNEKPFYSNQKAQTLKKYCTTLNKVIRYIWRS